MRSKDFIINKLNEIHSRFINSIIKYEFKAGRHSHIIEVLPIEIFESDEFIDISIELRKNFDCLFPQENLILVSENSLVKVTNALKTYKNSGLQLCFKNNEATFNNDLINVAFAGENNYALAA